MIIYSTRLVTINSSAFFTSLETLYLTSRIPTFFMPFSLRASVAPCALNLIKLNYQPNFEAL